MSVRAIFGRIFSPYWVDVAANLAAESGWDPCYFVAPTQLEPAIRERFPDAAFHFWLDAIRGIPATDCEGMTLPAADESLLRKMAGYEVVALGMMDRFASRTSFPFGERKDLYLSLVRYWQGVLERFEPEVVVFADTPHMVYDYVLYGLCRIAGVRTVMLEALSTGHFGVRDSFEGDTPTSRRYRELLQSNEPAGSGALSPEMERHLARLQQPYSEAIPFYMKGIVDDTANTRRTLLQRARRQADRVAGNVRTLSRWGRKLLTRERLQGVIKVKGVPIHQDAGHLRIAAHLTAGRYRKLRLRRYYARKSRAVELDRPFVLVALHFQPERTTCPERGVFVNQLLMIELLSACLPPGWMLYVKEHAAQFLTDRFGDQCRSEEYYDRILRLPNTRLVPLETDPYLLLDSCQAVATVTGTIGWEAVNRGKPVLHFGHPWYRGCEGAFFTPTVEACRKALQTIAGGFQVDAEKLRTFACAIEQTCWRGLTDPGQRETIERAEGSTYPISEVTCIRYMTEALESATKPFTEGEGLAAAHCVPDRLLKL